MRGVCFLLDFRSPFLEPTGTVFSQWFCARNSQPARQIWRTHRHKIVSEIVLGLFSDRSGCSRVALRFFWGCSGVENTRRPLSFVGVS